MKKVFIVLFLILTLSSCFSEEKDWLTNYETNNFSLKVPNNWEIIENKEWIIPTPRTGKIEFVVRSKNESNWFLNNLVILSEDNKEDLDSLYFSNLLNNNSKKDYFEYKKISEKEFHLKNWKKSKIIIFDARYNDETPKIKFLQTAISCSNKKVYSITLAIDKQIENILKYENILSSFNCKK